MANMYVVTSDRAQTVTGLAVFQEGEERTFNEMEAMGFHRIVGIPLAEGNLPEGCTLEVVPETGTDSEEVPEPGDFEEKPSQAEATKVVKK